MAKVFAPIMDVLPTNAKRQWDNEIINEILQNFEDKDEYTYTMRISVPEEDREEVTKKLRDKGVPNLLKLFEENDWSVSFLVDAW